MNLPNNLAPDAGSAIDKLDGVVEKVSDDVSHQARRAANTIRDAVADGADVVEKTVRPSVADHVSDAWDSTVETLSSFKNVSADTFEDVQDSMREIIRTRPLTSVALAIAAAIAADRLLQVFLDRR